MLSVCGLTSDWARGQPPPGARLEKAGERFLARFARGHSIWVWGCCEGR